MWCDPITWRSSSFSSQMILSTSLLLSFFTVCTSADVDRCCWRIKHGINMCQSAGQMCVIDTRVAKELTFTWTRLSASRRKLKSPKRKKGAGGWRASDILQGDRTVRNYSNKCDPNQLATFFLNNKADLAIYQQLIKVRNFQLLDEEDLSRDETDWNNLLMTYRRAFLRLAE